MPDIFELSDMNRSSDAITEQEFYVLIDWGIDSNL